MRPIKTLKRLIIAAVVVVAAVVAVLVWWIGGSDSPEEVSLEAAVAQLQEADDELSDANQGGTTADTDGGVDTGSEAGDGSGEGAEDAPVGSGSQDAEGNEGNAGDSGVEPADSDSTGGDDTTVAITNVDGIWSVDTSIGDFDYEQASGSFVGFRVEEELTFGEVTAVGRTGKITGQIELADGMLVSAEVTVDMASIATDRSQRDWPVRNALQVAQFPQASFSLTEPALLPAGAAAGEAFSVEAVGDLTVAGVTNPTVFELEAQLVDDTVVVVGSTEVVFADYGVETPKAPIVLSADEHGIIEFQLLLTR